MKTRATTIGLTIQILNVTLSADYAGGMYLNGSSLSPDAPELTKETLALSPRELADEIVRVYSPFVVGRNDIPVGLRDLYLIAQ